MVSLILLQSVLAVTFLVVWAIAGAVVVRQQ